MDKHVVCILILPLQVLGCGICFRFIGAIGLTIGFILIVYNIIYSIRYSPRNVGSDPWDARTLEWATPSPVPYYNFAKVPHVISTEALWDAKYRQHDLFPEPYEKIHMPNNSGVPFILGCIFFAWGFSFVLVCGYRRFSQPLVFLYAWLTVHWKRSRTLCTCRKVKATESKLRGSQL